MKYLIGSKLSFWSSRAETLCSMPVNKGTIAVISWSPFIRVHFRIPSYSGNTAHQGSDPGLLGYSYRGSSLYLCSRCQADSSSAAGASHNGSTSAGVCHRLRSQCSTVMCGDWAHITVSTLSNNCPWVAGVGRYQFKDENSLAVKYKEWHPHVALKRTFKSVFC